ncbi:MAG TPA: PAS domain-containing protein, partial [Sphingobacteriaceae bacterium]
MSDALQPVTILDHLSTPVAAYSGPDLTVRFANERMRALWGRGNDVIGLPLKEVLPGGSADAAMVNLENFRHSSTEIHTAECESRYYQDGELHQHLCRQEFKVISRDPEAVILHTILAIRGVHENPEPVYETDAEAQQGLINRFITQAPAGICLLDGPDFVFELVNPFYQQLFPDRKLLGRPLAKAIPEIVEGPLLSVLENVYRTGRTFEGKEVRFPFRSASGMVEERYFTFIYQARRDMNNEIDGIIVFAVEVTDAVLNRKKVDEQEMHLREMVMASPYGMMILQGDGMVIQIANQEIANLWQKKLDDITGRKLMEVLPEIGDQPFPKLLAKVYQTGISYGKQEETLFIKSPEGDVKRHVSFFYDPLFD